MNGSAPSPRPAVNRKVKLRVELLDARCVPSATALDTERLPEPVLGPAQISGERYDIGGMQGPLLRVPVDIAANRDVTVDWGDGTVTNGVVLSTLPGEAEVWTGRDMSDVKSGTKFLVTVTMTGREDLQPLVFRSEFVCGDAPNTDTDTNGTKTPSLDPAESPHVSEPPAAVSPPQASKPPSQPTPTPAAPAANPVVPALLLPPVRTESPYQAGEVQRLAERPAFVRLAYDGFALANPTTDRGASPVGGMMGTLLDEWALVTANPDVPLATEVADFAPIVVDAPKVPIAASPAASEISRIHEVRITAKIQIPTTLEVELTQAADSHVRNEARNLLIKLASESTPAVAHASPEKPNPKRTPCTLSRGIALLLLTAVNYWAFNTRRPRTRLESFSTTGEIPRS